MTVEWTFTFVSVNAKTREKPEIKFAITFRDGKLNIVLEPHTYGEILEQMKTSLMILLSYIAFFPQRNFVKIKLHTKKNQFAIHYLDKRFLEQNFLGILSLTEYNVSNPTEFWGVEEMMAQYIFDYFWEELKGFTYSPKDFKNFIEWTTQQVNDFYMDWLDSKKEETKETPTHGKRILPLRINGEKRYEQWWDIQLINEFGQPIIDLISFIDDKGFLVQDEAERIHQNLESMSLSALKMLIDQQGGWNIEYLKGKLPNNMGYQYTFFFKLFINEVRYMLIMNSAVYDVEQEMCIQMFRGNEFELLEHIAARIKLHKNLFTNDGRLKNPDDEKIIQKVIMQTVKEYF